MAGLAYQTLTALMKVHFVHPIC